MILFTADNHFNHRNILKYCNRPFETIEDMNFVLIENWNSVVTEKDDVYVLGDFCFKSGNNQEILSSLKGRKYLIEGNHDDEAIKLKGWKWVKKYYELKTNGNRFTLLHYPMRSWKGSYHLYGHCHGRLENDRLPKSCDVGVDCWDYTPVSMDDILEFLNPSK
jgi:calcineurin-like phosphoesterase family protein